MVAGELAFDGKCILFGFVLHNFVLAFAKHGWGCQLEVGGDAATHQAVNVDLKLVQGYSNLFDLLHGTLELQNADETKRRLDSHATLGRTHGQQ